MLEKAFKNEELGVEITSFIDKKLIVWFKAKEVAQILGYKKTRNAIEKHVSKKYKKEALVQGPLGGKQKCIFIKEAGFYELVFKSRLPAAKMFREWVFDKVLPSIRKYGYYRMIDSKRKQRVIFEGRKYYKHPVFSNYGASKNGEVINVKTGRIMRMADNGRGYLSFVICDKKLERPKTYLQHRFVYEVFKGAIPRCLEIDHQNSDKKDNRIKNLQLLNHRKSVQKGVNKKIVSINIETGEENKYASLTKASIELDIKVTHISRICCKRKYNKTATSKKDGKKYSFRYSD